MDRIRNYEQGVAEIETLTSIRSNLEVPATGYTPDESQPARDRVFTFAQEEEILSILGDIDTGVKNFVDKTNTNTEDIATNAVNIAQNKGSISANDKRISNIEKLLQGNLYDYETDTDSAYTKTVPAGAMPYAGIEKIGGKTVVWNQLFNFNTATETINGVTFTWNNEDLTCTLNGTATDVIRKTVLTIRGHANHTVLYSAGVIQQPSVGFIQVGDSYNPFTVQTNDLQGIYRQTYTNGNLYPRIYIPSGTVCENIVLHLNFFDLTLMFGAGNEPSTVKQFREMFPAEYYPYNKGELLSAGVTEVVSKKADTSTIATYPIPAEVQSLEGYGWSAGSVYNYIDYERKVFVQRVGSVDLGTLTWTTASNNRFLAELDSIPLLTDNNSYPIAICPKYEGATPNNYIIYDDVFHFSSTIHAIYIRDTSYSDVATFTSAVSGVYMNYALATPIETDISAYLSDDNPIEVEAGGTLTFPNSNGDNYRIPVPSEETYMINLQEAVSNG